MTSAALTASVELVLSSSFEKFEATTGADGNIYAH